MSGPESGPVPSLADWIATQPAADQPLLTAATGPDPVQGLKLGVAVSGGGDSMALLLLLARAAPAAGFTVEAATVDHRLRAEAAEEAAFVAATCDSLGIPHRILTWDSHPETGNLMAAASLARRQLLAGWARERGLERVLLAHTQDDQAESFLMALSRGTGLGGLTGMRPSWREGGVAFTRPLLGIGREALRSHLRRQGQAWREDPTNADDHYLRARTRKALAALGPVGITAERLAETIRNLAGVHEILDLRMAQFCAENVIEQSGALLIRLAAYAELAPELRWRLLGLVIRWVSGSPPRGEQIAALAQGIAQEGGQTLGGCQFHNNGTAILAFREARAIVATADGQWDHRWRVTGPQQPGQEIRALGRQGLDQCPDWRSTGAPGPVLAVTPAIWQGDRLIAAPLAGLNGDVWQATTSPSFEAFALSH